MDAELDRLHSERAEQLLSGAEKCPLQVSVSFADHEVNLGVGLSKSFVMIGTAPFDDWYCAAGGGEGEDVMFYGVCQDSYWPAEWLIPITDAREAVRFFVAHQVRSPIVKWDC